MTIDKLSHTTWKYKYHIVFAPKYRRQVVYRQIKDIGKILRQLCDLKKVEILEAEACPDHILVLDTDNIISYITMPNNGGWYDEKNSRCQEYHGETQRAAAQTGL